MFCSIIKHLGSGRALKKWGKTLDFVSCFPLHFFRALPLPACFTTEQRTVEASLFVSYNITRALVLSDTAEIRFWGRDTVFCRSAVHLNKTTKCRQLSVVFASSLDDSEKSTKLRAHTVNLAFKLRSFVG